MPERGVGGFGASLENLLRSGQDAVERKDGKGATGKGEVRGQARSGAAGGVKSKAKAKGKDLGAVGALIGGTDDFTLVDEEDHQRRKRVKHALGEDEEEAIFIEQDATAERSAVAHISAEFRAQVASGMVAGRSFTQGSCLVPDGPAQDELDEEEEEETPRRRRKRR